MLSIEQLLSLWERAADQRPAGRALTILAQGYPELRRSELAALPLGQRNELLLRLREQTFGPLLHTFASCPECRAPLEFDLTVDQLCSARAAGSGRGTADSAELSWEDYRVCFRLPNSQDLLAIELLPSSHAEQALARLLTRCVIWASHAGSALPAADLPAALVDPLAASMVARDPLAEILIDLCCPDCRHSWQAGFDIVGFLWTEVGVLARRTLSEIFTLARATGWTESTILALSARRRQAYLQLVGT